MQQVYELSRIDVGLGVELQLYGFAAGIDFNDAYGFRRNAQAVASDQRFALFRQQTKAVYQFFLHAIQIVVVFTIG